MYRYLPDWKYRLRIKDWAVSIPDGAVDTLEVGGELGGVVEGGGVAPEEGLVPGLGGEVADGALLGIQHLQPETTLQIKIFLFIFLIFFTYCKWSTCWMLHSIKNKQNRLYFSFYSVFRIRRMRKFLSLPVVDPLVRGTDPDPAPDSSIKQK
jgi:hypothetical protein